MPTHQHKKHASKPHQKQKKAFAKQTKAFAKPQKSHAKQSKSATKTVIPPTLTLARLQEIRKLVEVNNKSKQSTEMVICQIYKESSFNKNATNSKTSARGLMQLLIFPIQQIFQNRYEKNLGHPIWDAKELKKVHKQGKAFHDSAQIFDEATNIQYGTEYLQYCIDLKGSISAGYQKYRGPEEFDYYSKIQACAVKLKNNPNSIQSLIDMNK
ncbi:unnamed protein product [Commensalibacter communis]|uniref:transglycosylase SLT domain-containing protein n=1 Tax=Commensalibacter communis TaxID=2972786 RepID=UPI0022FF6B2A|nr:transglycosylase SLT domain-containing protein [Commensalibacter communis]CAI3952749.1 unnamed protein product [Commensalibacter communis]